MSKQVVAEVIALIEMGMIAPEDIVKCLRKANSEPEQALAAPVQEPVAFFDPQKESFYWAKPTRVIPPVTVDVEPLPLYTTPPAQPAPVQEPIGYLFQHEETGLTTVVDVQQVEWGFEKNNPRHQKIGPVYTTPPAQPAPVQPVAFEVGLVEWVGNKLMATPKTTTTPPASWVEMVTANLVREGVNKHKARELAEHFYGLVQPATVQPVATLFGSLPVYDNLPAAQRTWVGLTDEDKQGFWTADQMTQKEWGELFSAIEANLKEKNTNA
jgi:hypothetical protein